MFYSIFTFVTLCVVVSVAPAVWMGLRGGWLAVVLLTVIVCASTGVMHVALRSSFKQRPDPPRPPLR